MSATTDGVEFAALEYCSDRSFAPARLRLRHDEAGAWEVWRNGIPHLRPGIGYRLLRTRSCGVCSTDLARHHLPFPLPQVIGHEVVVVDEHGRRQVVEINASPAARGVAGDCPDCRDGIGRHCPRRLVLGIHDLPGGFGPWILAPHGAVVSVPDVVPDDVAVMVEPFAAAWRAVERLRIRDGDEIAVLGPRKLGMLVIAALAAHRRRLGIGLRIVALARRSALGEVARRMGADEFVDVSSGQGPGDAMFDVVIDTTGDPLALEAALRIARREVHLKSTHGLPAAGLQNPTALVVDELTVARFEPDRVAGLAGPLVWMSPSAGPTQRENRWLRGDDASDLLARLAARPDVACIPGARAVVVADLAGADRVMRPGDDERGLVRPEGLVLLDPEGGPARSPLASAVLDRGIVLSSSRCGDFRKALAVLAADADLRRSVAGLITHRFGADALPRAFDVARTRDCIKAVVEHPPVSPARRSGR